MTVTEISNIIIVPPIKQITDFVNRIFNIIPFSVKCKHIINDFGNSVTMPKNGVIDMSNLYEIIEKLCEAEGITITEMCRRANVPRGNLSDLLNNRQKSLSPKNLKKIADYFNVTIDYLLTGIKKEPVTESDELEKYIDMLRTRPEMRLLLDTQDGATKEQVEENVRFLDALRKAKNAD